MSREGIIKTHLAVVVILTALGASPVLSAADASPEGAKPTAESKPQVDPAPGDQGAPAEAKSPEPEVPASEGTPSEPVAVDAAPAQAQPPEKKPVEPITGAFGMTLGTRFEPSLVEKVLSEEPRSYRVADGSDRQGTLYRVEPKSPDPNFNTYSVATTEDGTIYNIDGGFSTDDRSSKCDVTKKIAAALTKKHGKPRGMGTIGEWYAYMDPTAEGYRGVRLYAVRCKRGIYSISYEDATLTRGPLPTQATPDGEPPPRKRVTITMPQPSPSLAPAPESNQSPGATASPEPVTSPVPATVPESVASPVPAAAPESVANPVPAAAAPESPKSAEPAAAPGN